MSKRWKHYNFVTNTALVVDFCKQYSLKLDFLNDGYQLRIEDVLDVYPVRERWHWLPDGSRGDWASAEDLRKLMFNKLTVTVPVPGVAVETKKPWWAFWRRG